MMPETKDVIYMMLDILESIERTSKSSKLFSVDARMLKNVKNELMHLINIEQIPRTVISKKVELIGLLPSVLADKKKFPKNEDLVKLAEKSLGIKINNWKKKSREEIIGRIIVAIDNMPEKDIETFVQAWKEFIYQDHLDKSQISKHSKKGKTFVDIWLAYFEEYKNKL